MAEKVRFNMNVPEVLELKFDGGRESESQYGAPEMMFTLADDRVMYVPVEVAQEMQRLQIRKGVVFRITKQSVQEGRKKGVRWLVERRDAIETQLADSVALARNGQRPGSSPAAAPSASAPIVPITRATSSANNTHTSNSIPATHFTVSAQIMAGCLTAAIDATLVAEQYAAARNMKLAFAEEDVRAIAATLYIQHQKEHRESTLSGASVNGGAQPWAH